MCLSQLSRGWGTGSKKNVVAQLVSRLSPSEIMIQERTNIGQLVYQLSNVPLKSVSFGQCTKQAYLYTETLGLWRNKIYSTNLYSHKHVYKYSMHNDKKHNYTLLKKIKGTWSAPSLVCGHSQVQLLEDMHNCTSLKSVMFKRQLTLLAMSLTQPWHLFKG